MSEYNNDSLTGQQLYCALLCDLSIQVEMKCSFDYDFLEKKAIGYQVNLSMPEK